MKLAEALLLRADMQKKLIQLRQRIQANARVDKGAKPAENPESLLKQALGLAEQLSGLIVSINRVNATAKVADGRSLMEAIAERNGLMSKVQTLNIAVVAAQTEVQRYSPREIKSVALLDIAKIQKQLEDLSKQVRVLNGKIQEANWKIEVKEQ